MVNKKKQSILSTSPNLVFHYFATYSRAHCYLQLHCNLVQHVKFLGAKLCKMDLICTNTGLKHLVQFRHFVALLYYWNFYLERRNVFRNWGTLLEFWLLVPWFRFQMFSIVKVKFGVNSHVTNCLVYIHDIPLPGLLRCCRKFRRIDLILAGCPLPFAFFVLTF